MITGYLVNINKSIKDYALYILKIWLPYMYGAQNEAYRMTEG